MEMVVTLLGLLRRWAAQLGPLVLIEIVVPGGTLIVTLLYLYRRWKIGGATRRRTLNHDWSPR